MNPVRSHASEARDSPTHAVLERPRSHFDGKAGCSCVASHAAPGVNPVDSDAVCERRCCTLHRRIRTDSWAAAPLIPLRDLMGRFGWHLEGATLMGRCPVGCATGRIRVGIRSGVIDPSCSCGDPAIARLSMWRHLGMSVVQLRAAEVMP